MIDPDHRPRRTVWLEDVSMRLAATGIAAIDAFDAQVLDGHRRHCRGVDIDPIARIAGMGRVRILDEHALDEDLTGRVRSGMDIDPVARAAVRRARSRQVDLAADDADVVAAVDVQATDHRHAGQLDDPVLAVVQAKVLVASGIRDTIGCAAVPAVAARWRRPGQLRAGRMLEGGQEGGQPDQEDGDAGHHQHNMSKVRTPGRLQRP